MTLERATAEEIIARLKAWRECGACPAWFVAGIANAEDCIALWMCEEDSK